MMKKLFLISLILFSVHTSNHALFGIKKKVVASLESAACVALALGSANILEKPLLANIFLTVGIDRFYAKVAAPTLRMFFVPRIITCAGRLVLLAVLLNHPLFMEKSSSLQEMINFLSVAKQNLTKTIEPILDIKV